MGVGGTEAPSAASEDGDGERRGDEAAGAHVVAGVGGGGAIEPSI